MHPAFIGIFSLVTLSVWGQGNLIPNPSFETAIDFTNIDEDADWNKCLRDDTPDYFTFHFNKNGQPQYDTLAGGPIPQDGASYVGIFCYRLHPLRGIADVREVVQVKLNAPLEKDSIYQFEMAVALDPESTHAINNMNVMFKEGLSGFRTEKKLFAQYPQIRFRGSYLEDTTWTILRTEYKARGFEKYLVLGNLINDRATGRKRVDFQIDKSKEKKWNLYASEEAAYYYIDQLSLRKKGKEQPQPALAEKTPPPQHAPEVSVPDTITLEEVTRDSVFVLRKIYFEFDKSELLPASTAELNQLLRFLIRHPKISILIEGHTDNVGGYDYNMQLSEERASAVVDYLVQHGIQAARLQFRGYGFTRPVTGNQSEADRSLNRRVAFRIIDEIQANEYKIVKEDTMMNQR